MSNSVGLKAFDNAAFIERLVLIIGDETYRDFAERAGISDTVLRKYIKGTIPSLDRALAIAKAAGVDLNWLTEGVGDGPNFSLSPKAIYRAAQSQVPPKAEQPVDLDSEFTLIDSFAVFASAGHGADVGHELRTEPMSFRTDWLRKEGLPADRLSVIRAKGDSMEPTISDNDVILVLMTNGEAPRDGLHVIRLDSGLFVKRLQFDPFGGLSVVSDNPAYKSYSVTREQREQLHIVGRVVWAGKKF